MRNIIFELYSRKDEFWYPYWLYLEIVNFSRFWWRGGWRGVLENEHVTYQKGKPEPFSLWKIRQEREMTWAAFACHFGERKALPCYLKWYLPILNKQVTYSHIRDLYIKGCEDENFITSHNTQNLTFTLERESGRIL